MIRIWYGNCALLLEGHAGAGPYGKDLVCCGASMLLGTLIVALKEQVAPWLRYFLGPGRGWVKCRPLKKAEGAFEVVLAGLRLLAETYPRFVRILPCAGKAPEVSAGAEKGL